MHSGILQDAELRGFSLLTGREGEYMLQQLLLAVTPVLVARPVQTSAQLVASKPTSIFRRADGTRVLRDTCPARV